MVETSKIATYSTTTYDIESSIQGIFVAQSLHTNYRFSYETMIRTGEFCQDNIAKN